MSTVIQFGHLPEVQSDLARSGLEPSDMGIRPLTLTEMTVTRIHAINGRPPVGYVIPYYDLTGKPVQFYRVRLLEWGVGDEQVKYKQPTQSLNHMYFPRKFLETLERQGKKYVIITEGEKKAACATKMGFPCVAVPGVDSWRNRTLILPADTKLEQGMISGTITAKIPSGMDNAVVVTDSGPIAVGMQDLIDLCVKEGLEVIIIFDSDDVGGVKFEVQRAAARLGYELRYRGLPIKNIRQLVLPAKGKKVGLDDFLVQRGADDLHALIKAVRSKRSAFPRHPNPKTFISSRLQKSKLSRKETQDIAMAVLAELEARGRRLRTTGSDELHYFDEITHKLYPVSLNNQRTPLHETDFGAFLYNEFNLGAADKRVIEWLATLYTGEPGVQEAETHKVLTRPYEYPDYIAYQTGASHFVIVTPDEDNPLILCENGSYGILFEQGQVEELNIRELEVQFYKHVDEGPKMLWADIFEQMNVTQPVTEDEATGRPRANVEQLRQLISILYYISPWLLRWRKTQLPIELVIGEAGSGKSSLLDLRQRIIMGRPYLSNMTTDIRDWYAGITARGGLHVLDNVHFTAAHRDFRQRLSDEICRLITEPEPHVEMRKLYTTDTLLYRAVRCTFAVTAIEQPFFNTDLLQRAAIFEVESIKRAHDSDWVSRQMRMGGGRESWVAHHLAALHKFLHLAIVRDEWDTNYPANHRLANYEQCLVLMARVFGIDGSWIPDALSYSTESHVQENDWTLQALREWVKSQKERAPDKYYRMTWTVQDIKNWMDNHEVYCKNGEVTNPWKLGRYMKSHQSALENILKIYSRGKKGNREQYAIYQHD